MTGSSPAVVVDRIGPDEWPRMREIRLAALADAPEMFGSTLARELAFDDAEWVRRAARPATLVAVRAGVDVGTAGVFETDGEWWLMGMWVAPAARGTGVADALVRTGEEIVAAAGATTLTLGVMEANERGMGAYHRLGYRPTGRREHVRDGRWEQVWIRPLGR